MLEIKYGLRDQNDEGTMESRANVRPHYQIMGGEWNLSLVISKWVEPWGTVRFWAQREGKIVWLVVGPGTSKIRLS